MTKAATCYLKVDPWKVEEHGFHQQYSRVSESIFSLGNEFMGVRGYFEEGYSGETMVGSYFNGIFERFFIEHPFAHRGMASQDQKMVNTIDWLYTRIILDGERLDLGECEYCDFVRSLDLRSGILRRSFIWKTKTGKKLRIIFERFISMVEPHLGCQRMSFEAMNFTGKIHIEIGLDFTLLHHNTSGFLSKPFDSIWLPIKSGVSKQITAIQAKTQTSGHMIFSSFQLRLPSVIKTRLKKSRNFVSQYFDVPLERKCRYSIDKIVINTTKKQINADPKIFWNKSIQYAEQFLKTDYESARKMQVLYWRGIWNKSDITIEGDCSHQQGIRFCIFHLHQTYHGVDASLNIPAKGLSGDGYDGKTWWDTETYCLPFYVFNNPKAARNLLEYRYKTLPHACKRSGEVDGCVGARYPMSTIDGTETCYVWQHGDIEIHVSGAVAYGIWYYDKVVGDKDFLYGKGIEILLQICRYYASRGQFSQKTGEFGFWNVMGPDEFHMQVNNNAYTNVLAKRMFEYTLKVIAEMKRNSSVHLAKVIKKVGIEPNELDDWKFKALKMRTNFNTETELYEQHDGFFDLPHIDCSKILPEEYPIYSHWPYLKIFRGDMLKQPDVLLLLLFFSQDYSLECKRINYDFYKPRCCHESSLSPAVHSILAVELGKHVEAYDFFSHAARLDIDDYNRNTWAGLHITSMAATWMNIVLGFGGLRMDGDVLTFAPSIPKQWKSFSFRLHYHNAMLYVHINKQTATFNTTANTLIPIRVFGKKYNVATSGVCVELPAVGHVAS